MAAKKGDRIVYRNKDKDWVEKGIGGSRGTTHDTQREAIDSARRKVVRDGGGELTVKGRDGQIRSKDTIAPGRDPFPPRDKEH